jgi:hypothetical protein
MPYKLLNYFPGHGKDKGGLQVDSTTYAFDIK